MCVVSETLNAPVLVLLVEAPPAEAASALCGLLNAADLARTVLWGAGLPTLDVVSAAYGEGGWTDPDSADGLRSQRLWAVADPGGGGESWGAGVQPVFSSLEAALAALGAWVLERDEGGAPVLVIHITVGGFKCRADVERAAGVLKMACDFRAAPGVLYNILIDSGTSLAFPPLEVVAAGESDVIKTLYRMASPVGDWGVELMAGVGVTCGPATRFFETVPSFGVSAALRFAATFFSESVRDCGVAAERDIRACAFVAPKEGEVIDKCEDVVSIHRSQRRFAVSDGATTASYSAEWARALCRHAVESPPPPLGGEGREGTDVEAGLMRGWLERPLEYWHPEVPWERLLRPSLFNKAKEGSGASLAGVEVLEDRDGDGLKFRAWALGDSCVIHFRGSQVISSTPMDSSANFSHVPTLLMTLPGY